MVQKDNLNELKKQKVLFITGPTAVGKSALAVRLAKELGGEVIGADSMQIYRGMDVGTGKISIRDMQGIPHHMIDIISAHQSYSVAQYVADARQKIIEVAARKKLPIVAGGTGLYIQALINGYDFSNVLKDDAIRLKYEKLCLEHGNLYVHDLLSRVDAESAKNIEPNDKKRLIRALEVYEKTGRPKSVSAAFPLKPCYNYYLLVMEEERDKLYRNINRRVDIMLAEGLVDEVNRFKLYRDMQCMQAIGYKEILQYLDGKVTLSAATEQVKINSRHYAKRQLTFMRSAQLMKNWFFPHQLEEELDKMRSFLTAVDKERYDDRRYY